MEIAYLRIVVQRLLLQYVKTTYNLDKVSYLMQFKPQWWPADLPFASPSDGKCNNKNTRKVLGSEALKQIIVSYNWYYNLSASPTSLEAGQDDCVFLDEGNIVKNLECFFESCDAQQREVDMSPNTCNATMGSEVLEQQLIFLLETKMYKRILEFMYNMSWDELTGISKILSTNIEASRPLNPPNLSALLSMPHDNMASPPLGFTALEVSKDGNCFFHSIALLLTGEHDNSSLFRLGASLHGINHLDHYLDTIYCGLGENLSDLMSWISSFTARGITSDLDTSNPKEMLRVALQNECMETLLDGAYSGVFQNLIMAGWLQASIQPHLSLGTVQVHNEVYAQALPPCSCYTGTRRELHILWTTADPTCQTLNHIVPLLPTNDNKIQHPATDEIPGLTLRTTCSHEECIRPSPTSVDGKWVQCDSTKGCSRWWHCICVGIFDCEKKKMHLLSNPTYASIQYFTVWQSREKNRSNFFL